LFAFLFTAACFVGSACALAADSLEQSFLEPPSSARPRTLWMWMNGNVTADGITRDLEAMRRVGLGGAIAFNIGEYIPRGPVDYGSEQWLELMTHAAREADRLGLELGMHNCPGWSSSGGPWITPEMSMQQLVWTETYVTGPGEGGIVLKQPFTRLEYYRDICVLAFPSLPGEEAPFASRVSAVRNGRGGAVEMKFLTDEDLSTSVAAGPENPLIFEFEEPFEARAITLFYTSGGSTIGFRLEASDDGINWQPVTRLTPASPRAIEDASLVDNFDPVRARYFRLTPNRNRGVTEFRLHPTARVPGWNYKANFVLRAAREEAPPAAAPGSFAIDIDQVLDLTRRMDRQGRLNFRFPPGSWTVLRIGHTARGQENIAAPDAGVGLESDKLSREATTFYFDRGIRPLLDRIGRLAGRSFTALEIDSYEVGMQNWTAGLEREFRRRNGYGITRYLPAITGRYVGNAEITERFLWDFRRTLADLIADNYYGRMRELCGRHGLALYVEPYGAGPGPYDELQIGGRVDVPMGEFWAHFPWDDIPSLRLAASIAHVRGQRIVAGEAFTSTEEQSRFLDHPYALKTTGDLAFSYGLNQMLFHRFAHQPHPTAVPGMTMGPWGFNFDRNNSWFDKSGPWLEYLARCQFLLQQGVSVADVLFFTGEGSPRMSKRMAPKLPPGYQFDAVDAEVLLRSRVEGDRLVLPGGGSYRLLLLPDDLKSITPELMRHLHRLVGEGAVVVGPKPRFSPTLRNYPDSDRQVRRLADELWGSDQPESASTGRGGKARKVHPPQALGTLLSDLQLQPDFEYTARDPGASLVWFHRKVRNADIYFVANRQRRPEEVVCTFRVGGRQPELWHPENGSIRQAAIYEAESGRTRVPLRLGPAESVFVVFREKARPVPQWLSRNGERVLETRIPEGTRLRRSATGNFTVLAWIKPDSDMTSMPGQERSRVDENGKSWVLPAREADLVYGPGHAGLGIAAARNGVFVAERTTNGATAVLVSRTPLSGWTHLAVVYREGKPALYLNGRPDREGVESGVTVHAEPHVEPPHDRLIYYFDGDMTRFELVDEALEPERIAELAARGVPAPDAPSILKLQRAASGAISVQVREPGTYALSDGRSATVAGALKPIPLDNPWEVLLTDRDGAVSFVLTNLVSLHKSAEERIRHFAGTAVYRTRFELDPAELQGKRLWLDLGRVAVIAEVHLNGRNLGTVWKPPYEVDLTGAARAGANDLEIRVTTLLVNRLIGDEALPAENEYDPRNRAIRRLPDWYVAGQPKPAGGRSTFSTWKFYRAGDPLVEAGLLGPVTLRPSVSVVFAD